MAFTSERETPKRFDVSYDDHVPQRQLSDFVVTRGDEKISICALDDARPSDQPLIARGNLISNDGKTLRIESEPLVEWCIEYSNDPRLWVRSDKVWYKLTKAARDYARTHDLARKRFEVCARIFILLTTLNPSECTFKGIAHLLSHPYMSMRGYSEKEVLSERDFILAQLRTLHDPAIVNAQFVRELKAKKPSQSKRHASQKFKKEPSANSSLDSPSPLTNGHAPHSQSWEPSAKLDAEGESKFMKRVEKSLTTVMKNRLAFPFRQPVDPEMDGCPDYLSRIAKPMDYGTIKQRIESKYYSSVADVMEDVRQVTRNCVQYNGEDHDFSKWAVTLEQKFEGLVRSAEEAEVAAMAKRNPTKKRRASDLPAGGKSVAKKAPKASRKGSKSSLDRSPSTDSPLKEEDTSPMKMCIRAEGQACDKAQAPNSKYCSADCGFIVARQRLTELSKSGFNPEEYVRAYITKALVHSRS